MLFDPNNSYLPSIIAFLLTLERSSPNARRIQRPVYVIAKWPHLYNLFLEFKSMFTVEDPWNPHADMSPAEKLIFNYIEIYFL